MNILAAEPLELLKTPPVDYFSQKFYFSRYGKIFKQGKYQIGVHAIYEISLDVLRTTLSDHPNHKIYEFTCSYMRGYFVLLDNDIHLLLTTDTPEVIHDPYVFTQSLDAQMNFKVQEFARLYSIDTFIRYDFPLFLAIIESYYAVLAELNKISGHEIHCRKVKNSFLYLRKIFQDLRKGLYFQPTQHLEFFAWIYHVEISAIAKILGTDRPVVLHDVATNTAFWPNLLATQSSEFFGGLQFSQVCCSDIDLAVMNDTKLTLLRENDESLRGLDQLHSMRLDITQPSDLLKTADVITANDILEHFPEDLSFQVFKSLWQSTGRLLVIHVPFEEVASVEFGHYSKFSRAKLIEWVSQLDNCNDRTEEMRYLTKGNDDSDFICEFLFLERITSGEQN